MKRLTIPFILLAAIAAPAAAQELPEGFEAGPVFTEFGPVHPVPDADFAIPEGASMAVTFDVADAAEEGRAHRSFNTAARFMNMHAGAGVEDLRAALVVHGQASWSLLTDGAWAARERGETNPSAAALTEMMDKGVRVILCGQSAAALGIERDELLPGVELALSAMTAHALLQQEGYTLNPF